MRSHNEELRVVNEELESAEVELQAQLEEIVRAQEELGKEMAFSESLMDSLPGIFYLYEAESLRLVRWNKNHQEVSGYTADEMIGKHVLSWHLPDNSDAVLAAINSLMEVGQASIEAPLVMKDGSEVPYLLTGKRFDTKDTSFFMGLGIDIKDRIEAERNLRESEVMHRAILDNAGIGLGYWGLEGRLILMNSIAAGYLDGKPEDLHRPQHQGPVRREGDDLPGPHQEGGDLGQADGVRGPCHLFREGSSWFLSVFTYVPGPSERESGVLIFSHDITRKEEHRGCPSFGKP